jgi:hypothetical protein
MNSTLPSLHSMVGWDMEDSCTVQLAFGCPCSWVDVEDIFRTPCKSADLFYISLAPGLNRIGGRRLRTNLWWFFPHCRAFVIEWYRSAHKKVNVGVTDKHYSPRALAPRAPASASQPPTTLPVICPFVAAIPRRDSRPGSPEENARLRAEMHQADAWEVLWRSRFW